jgi:hypothetical protein
MLWTPTRIILPHLKIYLEVDTLPHEKNYPNGGKMTPWTPEGRYGVRGVEDGADNGNEKGTE